MNASNPSSSDHLNRRADVPPVTGVVEALSIQETIDLMITAHPDIDKIVASVGGFGFAKNIGQDVLSLLKNQEIRKNEFYFLWKIDADGNIVE